MGTSRSRAPTGSRSVALRWSKRSMLRGSGTEFEGRVRACCSRKFSSRRAGQQETAAFMRRLAALSMPGQRLRASLAHCPCIAFGDPIDVAAAPEKVLGRDDEEPESVRALTDEASRSNSPGCHADLDHPTSQPDAGQGRPCQTLPGRNGQSRPILAICRTEPAVPSRTDLPHPGTSAVYSATPWRRDPHTDSSCSSRDCP